MPYRNIFRAILFLFLIAPLASAQSDARFGVKLGLSSATQQSDVFALLSAFGAEQTPRVGLALGGFANFGLTDKISVQPELLFVQKGTSFEGAGLLEGVESETFALNYIEIPVVAQLAFPFSGGSKAFYLETGPTLSLLVSAKSGDEDLGDVYTGSDFGWAAGLGVELGKIGINARYTIGLSNVGEPASDGDPTGEDDIDFASADITNVNLLLMVSYSF